MSALLCSIKLEHFKRVIFSDSICLPANGFFKRTGSGCGRGREFF